MYSDILLYLFISSKPKLEVEIFPPSNDEHLNLGHSTTGGEQPGPIRIRNLEDLIRQLEHSSRHLSSSPGSDEMGGGDHDRHFRYRNIAYYVCLIFFIVSCIYTFLSIPPLFIIFQLIFAVLSMQYL